MPWIRLRYRYYKMYIKEPLHFSRTISIRCSMEQSIIVTVPWLLHTTELQLWRQRSSIFGESWQGSLEETFISKTKMPEPLIFAGSENKIYLHDWLSQIALCCLVSSTILDDQKIVCALIYCYDTAKIAKSLFIFLFFSFSFN